MAAKATQQVIEANVLCRRTYRAELGPAAAALTRGRGVMQGTAEDQVKAPTGAGVRLVGIVEETVSVEGAPVSVVTFGEALMIAGQAAITANMELMVDGDGKMVTAEADAANERCGRAISAAAAEDDEFLGFFNPVLVRT